MTGMSDKDAMGLGTLGFQEPVARKMAAAAGFTRFEVVDWQVCVLLSVSSWCNAHFLVASALDLPLGRVTFACMHAE